MSPNTEETRKNEQNAMENKLREARPLTWEKLPDIELYMDQLLTYVNRLEPLEPLDGGLTKSMVNNYIKQEIIARPNGKRYTREHITSLSMLQLLKEVLPISICKELFEQLGIKDDPKKSYGDFLEALDWCMNMAADALAAFDSDRNAEKALRLALFSYAARRAAIALIENEASENDKEEPDKNAG